MHILEGSINVFSLNGSKFYKDSSLVALAVTIYFTS